MNKKDVILFSNEEDPYHIFSTFYPIEIIGRNVIYPSPEHLYQSYKYLYDSGNEKTDRINLEFVYKIIEQDTAIKTKALAELSKSPRTSTVNKLIDKYVALGIRERPDWKRVKDNIMRRTVYIKFSHNQRLMSELCDTKNMMILEKRGNILGKILMETRYLLCHESSYINPSKYSNWAIPGYLIMAADPGREALPEGREALPEGREALPKGINLINKYALFDLYMSERVDVFISLQDEVQGNPYIRRGKDLQTLR
jgi:predicted NAD-dependent protein-ADP-ribosyltransferase YbiA (DUF1768 family)